MSTRSYARVTRVCTRVLSKKRRKEKKRKYFKKRSGEKEQERLTERERDTKYKVKKKRRKEEVARRARDPVAKSKGKGANGTANEAAIKTIGLWSPVGKPVPPSRL